MAAWPAIAPTTVGNTTIRPRSPTGAPHHGKEMRDLRQGAAVRTQREPLEAAHQPPVPAQPADRAGAGRGSARTGSRLHSLPADPRGRSLNAAFFAAAGALFAGCLAIQYVGYARLLATGLRQPDVAARRAGIRRWLLFALTWQSIVFVGVFVYALVMTHVHHAGLAWIAPPLAALIGTALPYQLAAGRL